MPSALSWFRKNQKIMLGFFSVGLMFIFTFSLGVGVDPIMDRLSGRADGGPSTETVVTWDDGQLDSRQLDRLRVNRNLLRRFMGQVMQMSRQRGGQQRVAMLQLYSGDRSLLELEMLVQEAEKMGIEVNDASVLDYLNQLTDGTIPAAEYQQILRDSTGKHLPANSLFPLLARELKAQKVRGLIQSGNFPASPIAAWDYYNRLNRLVRAEIMPVDAADYIDQVSEPSETDVAELFEKYKKFYHMPLSPEPGFRQHEKRAFQYVKVNYDAILEKEKAAVTDAEIQAYYDENRESFVEQDDDPLGLGAAGGNTTPEGEKEPQAEKAESDADEKRADDKADPETEKRNAEEAADERAESNDATPNQPESPAAADGAPNADKPADAEPADAGSDVKPSPSPTALPQDDDAPVTETTEDAAESDAKKNSPPRQDNTGAGSASDGAAADNPSSEDAASPEPSQAAAATADKSDTSGDAPNEKPDQDVADDTATDDQTEASTTNAADISDLDDIASYRPLSEVADEIRQSLAAPKAQVKMKQLLDGVQRDMERYSQDRTLWEMDREDDPDLPPPSMPDFAAVVDGKQAVMDKIDLTNRLDIANTEIGQAFDIAIYGRENIQRIFFADVAFQPSLTPFRPALFPKLDMATDRYVYWLTEVTEEYIPELDEVRPEVVQTWKQQRALDLALADAATLVEKARQEGTTLQQSLASDKRTQFIDTGEVSWVTAPFQQGATPTISPITGAEDAGPEMRSRLFRLAPGGIDYAANLPKNKVYVFRVSSESPDIEVRREQFLNDGVDAPILFLARRDSMVGLSDWYRELTIRHGVDWQRDPQVGDNGEM